MSILESFDVKLDRKPIENLKVGEVIVLSRRGTYEDWVTARVTGIEHRQPPKVLFEFYDVQIEQRGKPVPSLTVKPGEYVTTTYLVSKR